jgi:methyl-accepting chemotaxis protein
VDLAARESRTTGLRIEVTSVAGRYAGVILALLQGVLLSLSIKRPLAKGVAFAKVVSGGDFTQKLNIPGKDEVGVLAAALNAVVGGPAAQSTSYRRARRTWLRRVKRSARQR